MITGSLSGDVTASTAFTPNITTITTDNGGVSHIYAQRQGEGQFFGLKRT